MNWFKKWLRRRDILKMVRLTRKLIKRNWASAETTPIYPYFEPNTYVIKTFTIGSVRFQVMREIRADLIEVFIGESKDTTLEFVDQTHQYGWMLGYGDILARGTFEQFEAALGETK